MLMYLRRAAESDLALMMAWRSDKEINCGFYQQSRRESTWLEWGGHYRWWSTRPSDWDTYVVMVIDDAISECSPRPVGVVTIGQKSHWEPEIGIYIGEKSLWGKGVGKSALQLIVDLLRDQGYEYAKSTILDSNERSQRLFASVGFEKTGESRRGESRWQLRIKQRTATTITTR